MKTLRVGVTAVSIVLLQALVCGIAVIPAAYLWGAAVDSVPTGAARLLAASMLLAPAYVVFALCLMPVSAAVSRLFGIRTPPGVELDIADASWPLMRWVHYMTASHIVRLFSGSLFRGSPLWTAYLRMNGARIGRRVFINTLAIADHNMLEIADDVVIGADVHLSGHTVERGRVKTALVRIGSNVTIGLGSIIEIDVEIGDGSQIGALTFVPKHSRLEGSAVYVGIPARRLSVHSV